MKSSQSFGTLTRRRFTSISTLGFLGLMTSSAGATIATPSFLSHDRRVASPQSMNSFGTTFSQLQCWYLGLDYQETFREICQLGFKRVRLCSYWHEIQPKERTFDYSALDWLLDECDRHNIEVVLTVGMKAPRYPEFHFPDWFRDRYDTQTTRKPLDANPAIADHTLYFIDRVVRHTRSSPAIKYWQVENEPFTRLEITKGRSISPQFVQKEVELVRSRSLPRQKILLTNAITLPDGQLTEDEHAFEASLKLADAVGFNVYTKVPQSTTQAYLEAQPSYWTKLKAWQTELQRQGKEAWIAEAQAEPWEPNELVPVAHVDYPSSSPAQAASIVDSAQAIGFNPILLWGCEYWYWNYKQGRNQWWQGMQQLISFNH
jgi:hypothetical protein